MFTVPVPGLGIEIIRRQQRMWTMEAEKDPKKEKMNPFEDKKECCHLEGSFFSLKCHSLQIAHLLSEFLGNAKLFFRELPPAGVRSIKLKLVSTTC